MKALSLRTLGQAYLVVLLLLATILSPLPYSPAALVLLTVTLLLFYRSRYPRLRVAITLATMFLLPLALEQLLGYLADTGLLSTASLSLGVFALMPAQGIAAIAALPAIYLLDSGLKESTQSPDPTGELKPGRSVTATTTSLFVSAFVMLFVSIVISSPTLFLTSAILTLYLLVVLVRVLGAVPVLAIDMPVIEKRVIAGSTTDIDLRPVSRASTRLVSTIVPIEPWVKAWPMSFSLDGTGAQLLLSVTPPLAGPSRPQVRVSVVDPRGLVRVDQVVEPVALHVIPRATYAEWLAMRYLEQTGTRGTVVSTAPEPSPMPKRGTEYFDSRGYQPGDELRRVDWKHTVKLNQLTIKEFVEAGGRTVIIGVNLSVSDTEEADRLAFDLITTALTLAQETVPTSLAAYNHEAVILTTTPIDPREMLKQALALVNSITLVEPGGRVLQPADISRLRRNIVRLKEATSQPAQQLMQILDFEYQAIEEAARNHPATLALSRATERVPPPATIFLVSRLNNDAEAIMVATEKLSRRGFVTIPLETTR